MVVVANLVRVCLTVDGSWLPCVTRTGGEGALRDLNGRWTSGFSGSFGEGGGRFASCKVTSCGVWS